MDYKVSKQTAEMIDALRTVTGLYSKIYDALKQVYSEDNVLALINGGFNRALLSLDEEIWKLIKILVDENLNDEEKKGLI